MTVTISGECSKNSKSRHNEVRTHARSVRRSDAARFSPLHPPTSVAMAAPPATPPCTISLPPSPPASAEQLPTTAIIIAIIAILLVSALLFLYLYTRIRQLRRERDEDDRQAALRAIDTTCSMRFVACFLRGSDFLEMGKLKSPRAARDTGKAHLSRYV